jgi:hypothetical protein
MYSLLLSFKEISSAPRECIVAVSVPLEISMVVLIFAVIVIAQI